MPKNTSLLPEKAYLTIGEISQLTKVKTHILRVWEKKINLLRPIRRESGHRKYRRSDVETILKIKDLIQSRGFTIAGAKTFLLQQAKEQPKQLRIELEDTGAAFQLLQETKKALQEIIELCQK